MHCAYYVCYALFLLFQVCSILSRYNIDPQVKDRWGKVARDYGLSKGDKRFASLHKYFPPQQPVEKPMHSSTKNIEKSTTPVIKEKVEKKPVVETKSKKKRKRKRKDKEAEEKEDEHETAEAEIPQPSVSEEIVKPTLDLNGLLAKIFQQPEEYFIISALDTSKEIITIFRPIAVSVFDPHVAELDQKLVSPFCHGAILEFEDLPWEVECTEKFLKLLKDKSLSESIREFMAAMLYQLAQGKNWASSLTSKVASHQPEVFETRLSSSSQARIVWEVAVQFSCRCTDKCDGTNAVRHMYSEVIRVWDATTSLEYRDKCIEEIQASHKRGVTAEVSLFLQSQKVLGSGKHSKSTSTRLPVQYLLDNQDKALTRKSSTKQRYVPAAGMDNNEFNVVTFYPMTSTFVNSALYGENPRRDFPFKEWPKEYDIINAPTNKESILLIGRSGTGKTTCCLYRLWSQFYDYWKQACTIGAWHPHNPLPLLQQRAPPIPQELQDEVIRELEEFEDVAGSAKIELEHLHQVFITKNYVLCAQMKKRFYDMTASHEFLSEHLQYENVSLPVSLSLVDDTLAYPLFLTSRQFLLLLDGSLEVGTPFFPRNKDGSLAVKLSSSDYDHEDPDTLLDLEESDGEDDEDDIQMQHYVPNNQPPQPKQSTQIWCEVTATYFVEKIWPKICHCCSNKSIDPLLVWMEIKSFIKGSALALDSPEGFLTEAEYESLGRKLAANFSSNRKEIYQLFLQYEDYLHKKRSLYLYDECQVVHSIYQRLIQEKTDVRWSIHHFYVDEVQDFTQAELCVLLYCSREPNSLFLTGDTAQSIMRGVSFRFTDLRSLFHHASEVLSRCNTPVSISVPCVQQLTINFRSHSGILRLATSIIDILMEYFRNSFDCLPEDSGMFPGPSPIFLESCEVSDLAVLLQSNKRVSSSIEFGAHQVIIVQTDEAKKSLPDSLKTGIVLTVFEAKGLEFDDVLLYNFFSDSRVSWCALLYAEQMYM